MWCGMRDSGVDSRTVARCIRSNKCVFKMNDYEFVAGPRRDVLADGIDDGRGKRKEEREVVNAL